MDVELWRAGEQSSVLAEISDGSLLWTIPDDIALGGDYQIAVRDADLPAVLDLSNETFAITGTFDVTEPTKDDILRLGEQMTIVWNLTAPHGETVDILRDAPTTRHRVVGER